MKTSICLTMIVKNESAIIERCLEAVQDRVDYFAIVDTGSTDDTKEKILATMKRPGKLIERSWRGFADAKTSSLELAREVSNGQGYALVLDADELIEGEFPTELTHGAYGIWMKIFALRYKNVRFFRLSEPWYFRGVLHEFPTCRHAVSEAMIDATITSPRDGARGKEPDRYARDAQLLEDEIAAISKLDYQGPDKDLLERYVFYLAQSYRDAGDNKRALENYLRRVELGAGSNWEEIYISLLNAGRALQRMGLHHQSQKMFLRAHHVWPQRAEAIRALACIFEPARETVDAAPLVGSLFVETT